MADTENIDPERAEEFAKGVEKTRSCSTSTPMTIKTLSNSVLSEQDSGFADTTADSCFLTTTTGVYTPSYVTHSSFYSPISHEQCPAKPEPLDEPVYNWEEDSIVQRINARHFDDLPRRNLTFDTDCDSDSVLGSRFQEVLKAFSPPVLDRLIGRKMGLEHVDIVSELSRHNVPVCLAAVFRFLEAKDLCRMCQVSRRWKKIIESDKISASRRKVYLKQAKAEAKLKKESRLKDKENLMSLTTKTTISCGKLSLTPDSYLNIQHSTPCNPPRNSTPCSNLSSNDVFALAAKSLREGEVLRHCPKCFGASRVLPGYERGKCFNHNCQFDYCAMCFGSYHDSRPCTWNSAVKRSKTEIVGSKKCKKSLKRLCAL